MRKNNKTQLAKPIILSSCNPEIWKKVVKAKRTLIETGNLPDYANFIPQEIIFMWKRSIQYGLKWEDPINVPKLSEEEFNIIKIRKKLFIEIATEFIEEFHGISEVTDFTMSITDENGVFLTKAHNSDKIWKHIMEVKTGDVWNEQYIGCTAHTLALAYNRPIQIIGPANFYKLLENNLSYAAPVFNEYGNTIGSIRLIQKNAKITNMMTHTLGWVTSVASAITSQLKLLRRDTRLKLMDSTLKATFAHVDNGYISIDDSGYIVNINKEASRILNIQNSKINLFSILKNPIPVINSLATGRAILEQNLTLTSNENISFIVDIEPFHGDRKKHAQGAIIRIRRKSNMAKLCIKPSSSDITFDKIIGRSPAMETLKDTAKIFSKKPISILLSGESGTGKEVFAKAIHNYNYKPGPFVAINCSAIPAYLIESELFGYEKGAFTGAEKTGKKGKIEHANGGTLFLDEIGDMPIELQPVLLRVLEEKEVTRVGGNKSISVDFRIISATNKPLYNSLLEKKFRQDLYFRLAVANLEIPPLRERGDDVLLLADNFIKNTCNNFNMPVCSMSKETEKILIEYIWPGNVRQLQNAITYAVTIASERIIQVHDLPKDIISGTTYANLGKLGIIKDIEKEVILKTLHDVGNAKEAAKQLGISRATLYRKLKN